MQRVHGFELRAHYDVELARWLRLQVLTLLKKLSYSPHFDLGQLMQASQDLLGEPYPHGHLFWQDPAMGDAPKGSWTQQRG